MGKRVAIFIDYDNIFITLEKYYQKSSMSTPLAIDIITKIKDHFSDDKILTFKSFADFQKINAVLTTLQKNQVELRHVYSSSTRKNASDIALTISLMKSLYSNESIEKYVIISSDSDMLPLINEMNYFDKEVFVMYSEFSSKEGYSEYLSKDNYKTIEELLNISTYDPIIDDKLIDDSKIAPNLENYLNTVNNGIIKIFNKYINQGGGTVSKADVKEILYEDTMLDLVKNDGSLIIDYLLKKQYISEVTSPVNLKYKVIFVNEINVKGVGITLKNQVISNANYQKDANGKLNKIPLTK